MKLKQAFKKPLVLIQLIFLITMAMCWILTDKVRVFLFARGKKGDNNNNET